MANAQGFSESIVMGPETSFKTLPGSPTAFKLPVMNPSFKPTVQRFKSEALTGSAEPRVPVDGKIEMQGSFDLECSYKSLGYPLKAVMGPGADQGVAGNYDHIFTLGTLGSWFIEQRFTDITQYFLYGGVRFDKASFTYDPEGLMKANFSCMGASTTLSGATAVTGTLTDVTTAQPISYLTGVIYFQGAAIAYCQQVKIDIDRQMDKVKCIDGTNTLTDLITKIADVKVSMKALFQDATLMNIALNSTECSMDIFVPSTTLGYGLKVSLSTLKLMPNGPTTNGPGGLVTLELTGDAYGTASTSNFSAFMYTKGFTTVTVVGSSADTLVWKIDGGGSLTTTLTPGARTPAQIATDIAATTGFSAVATAVVENGRVLVTSKAISAVGASTSVQLVSGNAASILGLPTATYNGLTAKSVRFILSDDVATY